MTAATQYIRLQGAASHNTSTADGPSTTTNKGSISFDAADAVSRTTAAAKESSLPYIIPGTRSAAFSATDTSAAATY